MTPRSTMMQQQSLRSSPRRQMAAKRLQTASSQSCLLSEVRQSLSMPGSSTFHDEEPNNEQQEENPFLPATPRTSSSSSLRQFDEDEYSIGSSSVMSTFSTASKRKKRFLQLWRKKTAEDDDDEEVSVSSASSRFSWWSQGSTSSSKRRKKKKKRHYFRRLRLRKKKTRHDQLVSDFFDGRSVESSPEVSSPARVEEEDSHSVSSRFSISSSSSKGFIGWLFRNSKQQQQNGDFFGTSPLVINAGRAPPRIDDEEITLASGLDNLSQTDNDSVASRSSDTQNYQQQQQRPPMPKKQKRPKTFLDRMLKRRKRKKKDTNLRLALRGGEERSESEGTVDGLILPARGSPMKKSRSVKSLGDMPSSSSTDDVATVVAVVPASRWDSHDSVASEQSAPKKPQRQTEQEQTAEPSSYSKLKASQSMQNLTVGTLNEFCQEDSDSDDDSVLSLLSGLLMTWSAEQIEKDEDSFSLKKKSRDGDSIKVRSILKCTTTETDSTESAQQQQHQHSVVFAHVEIREYDRILGDNPSCTRGPPMSIGWTYVLVYHDDLDYYETVVKTTKRSKREFYCTAEKRTHMLMNEWGVLQEDIQRVKREATYIQFCRSKTSFSSSRAAAKEAAFLRKENDRTKMLFLNKQNNLQNNMERRPPPERRVDIPVLVPIQRNERAPESRPELPESLRRNLPALAKTPSLSKAPSSTLSHSPSIPPPTATSPKEIRIEPPEEMPETPPSPPPSMEESSVSASSGIPADNNTPVEQSPFVEI